MKLWQLFVIASIILAPFYYDYYFLKGDWITLGFIIFIYWAFLLASGIILGFNLELSSNKGDK